MTNREEPPVSPSLRRDFGLAYALFFLSGAAALVYEVSWSRQVGLVLGNTAAAASLVLASYFTGLAAGQFLGGRLAARVQPLAGYGGAELAAAAWACLVPTLLPVVGTRGVFPDAPYYVRAAWCFAVLSPTTIALGATLPFMAEYFSRRGADGGRRVSLAYALNTAGGLVGVLAATAGLLVAVGVRTSSYSAAGVSAASGLAALVLSLARGRRVPSEARVTRVQEERVSAGWLAIAAASGFGTLGLEVLYTRLFALVFHNSIYTFGAVVAVFLAGLALGALLVSAIGSRISPRTIAMGATSLGAVAVAASVVLFVRTTGLEYFAGGTTFAGYLARAFALVAAVVLPPVVLLGMVLPAAFTAACGAGQSVGRLAAVNTVAAAAGALTSGFLLVPWLGLWEALGLHVALFGLTAAAVLFRTGRSGRAVGVCGVTALAAAVAASGQAQVPPPHGEEVVRRWSTAYGWVDVVRSTKDDSLTVRQNLHYRHGSTGKNAAREYRQGRFPLLLHPRPSEVAFLGLGTGLTATPAVADRGVERVVIVELIPEVVEAARLLGDANLGVVDHGKVEVCVDDARHYLGQTGRRFDVIVADLFVPWESRSGYLYTLEFYESARRQLKPGGLFCQWVALYQVGPADFELIADSFAAAFPFATLWWGQFDARFPIVALVGSDAPLTLDATGLAARWASAGEGLGGADPELQRWEDLPELFLGRWPARPASVLNTDEHPRLEFRAPVSHRAGWTLQGAELRSYFDRVLTGIPSDGIALGSERPWADTDPARRRARQRLNLFGP
jgi:spermidine synthase